jgi:hypothetical protein
MNDNAFKAHGIRSAIMRELRRWGGIDRRCKRCGTVEYEQMLTRALRRDYTCEHGCDALPLRYRTWAGTLRD